MKLHTGLLVGLLVACVITTTSAETGSGIILMDVTIQQKAQAIAPPRASLSFTRLPTDASTRGAPTVMHADRHLQAVPPAPKVVKMAGLLANFGPQFTKPTVYLANLVAAGGPADACVPSEITAGGINATGAIVYAKQNNCTFVNKTESIQTVGGIAALIAVNATTKKALIMGSGAGADHIKIPAVSISNANGATLESLLADPLTLGIEIRMRQFEAPYWDGSQLFLFIIALGCLIGAAFWATVKERHAFLVKVHQTVGESAPPPPALAGPEAVPYEEPPVELTTQAAWCFIVAASLVLVVLFFFINYLIYVVIVMFCLLGAQSVHFVSYAFSVAFMSPERRAGCTAPVLRLRGESLSKLALILLIPSFTIAIWFFFARKASYSWFLQDVMAVCILLMIQRALRLPSIRISAILLCLAFIYDIFWVFISPYIFKQSVMLSVATGGDTSETMPMVLRLPHTQKTDLDAYTGDRSRDYSLLGFGDIALPGLLVTFCLRYDYFTMIYPNAHLGTLWYRSYFWMSVIGYAFGLFFAEIAVVLMQTGQPALLYLVPCTLGLVAMLAHQRGDLPKMWAGFDDRPREAMAADGTSADTANVARPTVASLNDTEMTGSDTRTAPAGDAHADVRYSRHTDLDGPDDNV